jgi:hypothetical protein
MQRITAREDEIKGAEDELNSIQSGIRNQNLRESMMLGSMSSPRRLE